MEDKKYDILKVKREIRNQLKYLGIPASLKGYTALGTAIELVLEKPQMLGAITKELYPRVGRIWDSTGSRMERTMRHAIEVAFDRITPDVQYEFFGNSLDPQKGKPTNKEFIATVANRVKEILDG